MDWAFFKKGQAKSSPKKQAEEFTATEERLHRLSSHEDPTFSASSKNPEPPLSATNESLPSWEPFMLGENETPQPEIPSFQFEFLAESSSPLSSDSPEPANVKFLENDAMVFSSPELDEIAQESSSFSSLHFPDALEPQTVSVEPFINQTSNLEEVLPAVSTSLEAFTSFATDYPASDPFFDDTQPALGHDAFEPLGEETSTVWEVDSGLASEDSSSWGTVPPMVPDASIASLSDLPITFISTASGDTLPSDEFQDFTQTESDADHSFFSPPADEDPPMPLPIEAEPLWQQPALEEISSEEFLLPDEAPEPLMVMGPSDEKLEVPNLEETWSDLTLSSTWEETEPDEFFSLPETPEAPFSSLDTVLPALAEGTIEFQQASVPTFSSSPPPSLADTLEDWATSTLHEEVRFIQTSINDLVNGYFSQAERLEDNHPNP
jgi:hypothetical protein